MRHYHPRGLHLHYQVGFGYLKRPVGHSNEVEEVIDLATVLDAPFVHINRSACWLDGRHFGRGSSWESQFGCRPRCLSLLWCCWFLCFESLYFSFLAAFENMELVLFSYFLITWKLQEASNKGQLQNDQWRDSLPWTYHI